LPASLRDELIAKLRRDAARLQVDLVPLQPA
jgi:hypothetical protein